MKRTTLCLFLIACGSPAMKNPVPTQQDDSKLSAVDAEPATASPTGIWEITTTSPHGTALDAKGLLIVRADGTFVGSGAPSSAAPYANPMTQVSGMLDSNGTIMSGVWSVPPNAGTISGSFSGTTGSGTFDFADGTWTAVKVATETGEPGTAAALVGTWRYHAKQAAPPFSRADIIIEPDGDARAVITEANVPSTVGTCDVVITLYAQYTVTSAGALSVETTGYTRITSNCTLASDNGVAPSTINVGTFTCHFDIAEDDIMILTGCSDFMGQTVDANFGATHTFLTRQ